MNNLNIFIIYLICFIILCILLNLEIINDKYNILITFIIILLQGIPIYIIYKSQCSNIIGKGLINKCSPLIEANVSPFSEMCYNGKVDKKISLEIHPDKNLGCIKEATKYTQDVQNFCQQNIIPKKPQYDNNYTNNYSTDKYSTEKNYTNNYSNSYKFNTNNSYNSKPNYSSLSQYDLQQKFNSGDTLAMRELASRQSIRNIKLDPNENSNSDFCTIM